MSPGLPLTPVHKGPRPAATLPPDGAAPRGSLTTHPGHAQQTQAQHVHEDRDSRHTAQSTHSPRHEGKLGTERPGSSLHPYPFLPLTSLPGGHEPHPPTEDTRAEDTRAGLEQEGRRVGTPGCSSAFCR